MRSVLRVPDFRWLFVGQATSSIGDQFHLIALPWLVLMLTGDPLQLGLVLAAAGVPRAALMLVGGAWADRYSPRAIMLISDILRFVLTASLAAAILSGTAQMWMVYLLAIAFGIVSGFFLPAAQSAIPRLLDESLLERGNSLMMGVNQLANFVGPVVAGLLIAAFGAGTRGGDVASFTGIGMAFAFDAVSFLISAIFLARMTRLSAPGVREGSHPLADIVEGLKYAWDRQRIRWMVLMVAGANFLIAGPMLVGVPVLAQSQLTGGAAALGTLLSAYGLGSLAGILAAASTPRPGERSFSWLVAGLMASFALSMACLGLVHITWIAAVLMFLTGVGNGYIGIVVMTAIQRTTDQLFLGRVMSLIMLGVVGLVPISQVLSGVVMGISSTALFLGTAAGFMGLSFVAIAKRSIWTAPQDGAVTLSEPVYAEC